MKMQLINLYVAELRPKKEWLTADSIAIAAFSFILMMLLTHFFMNQQLLKQEEALASLEKQQGDTQERLKKIKQLARQSEIVSVDATIASLKEQIDNTEHVSAIISGQSYGNRIGFSNQMKGLSLQSLSSLSLEKIRVSRGGKFIELRGKTNNPEDVPVYIEKLRGEAAFSETQFGLISLAKSKANAFHDFSLGFDKVYLALEEPQE